MTKASIKLKEIQDIRRHARRHMSVIAHMSLARSSRNPSVIKLYQTTLFELLKSSIFMEWLNSDFDLTFINL